MVATGAIIWKPGFTFPTTLSDYVYPRSGHNITTNWTGTNQSENDTKKYT